ncbi:MAG: hypothetical protein JEZ12_28235, partial [Desulfobacterium sp.]|nr:hypothetical protein [Desulfobacterium sp.]
VAQQEIHNTRVTELSKSIDQAKGDIDQANKIFNDELTAIGQENSTITSQLDQARKVLALEPAFLEATKTAATLAADISRIEYEKKQLAEQGDKANEAIIRSGQREKTLAQDLLLASKEDNLKPITEKNDEARSNCVVVRELLKDLREKLTNVGDTVQLAHLNSCIDTCKKRSSLLGNRPPGCQSDGCSFIVDAVAANNELPILKDQRREILDNIEKERISLNESISAQEKELELREKRFVDACSAWNEAKNKQDTECKRIKGLQAVQAGASEALVNERDRLRTQWQGKSFLIENELLPALEETKALSQKGGDIKAAKETGALLENQIKALKAREEKISQAHTTAIKKIETLIQDTVEIRYDVMKLIDPKTAENLRAAERARVMHSNGVADMETTLKTMEKQLDSLDRDMEESKKLTAEIKRRTAAIADIEQEISQWKYIQLGCGPQGLQALEIDGVAPLIAKYGNDLLSQSFGPNFTMKLITQNEDGKEVLDIIVIREDGSETKVQNLSGGQQVWILKALRLAMTLTSKEKSGKKLETFFADEEDGALDDERALNFLGLYRSMLSVGNFTDCYFISHKKEVVALADHLLVFGKGGITVA